MTPVSRRALLRAAALTSGWLASPWRALLAAPLADTGTSQDDSALDALITRMTAEEKAGQLTLEPSAGGGPGAALNPQRPGLALGRQLDDARNGRLTGVFNSHHVEPLVALQRAAMQSRLAIPMLFAADVIHGWKTVFPMPLAEAASFDTDLAQRTARAAAREATAMGVDWTFAPMVDIARDARWGRGIEGAGEDVLLGCRMAAARVRGFQGDSLRDDVAMLACAKHFAGYGAAEAGLDYTGSDISERVLREVYLPPFRAALDAGALSVMAAFNEVLGVPATASHWLQTEVLRDEWGFDGLVVSDYGADQQLIAHGVAADDRDAARLAFMAGIDVCMASGLYLQHLPGLVAAGQVPMARLDQAVRRVLRIKQRLGLFDDPFRRLDPERAAHRVGTAETRALAREAAQRSIVMLKNDGDLLPLPRAGLRIALIGPFAQGQRDLVGPWTIFGRDRDAVDLATGFRDALDDPAFLSIEAGCDITTFIAHGFERAVAAANAADVVVLALGEAQDMSGEARSTPDIGLPEVQLQLAAAVARAGKPTVVLLRNGRALALHETVQGAEALLVTWFLGSETGHAVADVIFGSVSPSGRLPVSFPQAAGAVPYYYAHKPSGRPASDDVHEPFTAHYPGLTQRALYPFGHGLNYGRMRYADLDLGSGQLATQGSLHIAATLTNDGRSRATELVQLYVRDRVAQITQPVRRLVDWRQVTLEPGTSQRVQFELTAETLAYLGPGLAPTVEPGEFDVWIAPSAEAEGLSGRLIVAGAASSP